jgi:hypothetical protein
MFPKTPPGARVFRSGGIRFSGWAWMVFAVLNLIDLAWRGRDIASLIAVAVMLFGSGIAYVVALRPRILADDEAVSLHNLFRDVRVPWSAVERVEGGDAVYVHSAGRRFRAFVLQTSPRSRAKAEMRARRDEDPLPDAVAEYVRGRTATDFAVDQLRDQAKEAKKTDDEALASVTWAWPAIVALALPGVLTLATIIVAMV